MKGRSGFGGHGFKFDETEHQMAAERKKLQKAALGLQDSDEEDAVDVSLSVLSISFFSLDEVAFQLSMLQL